MPSSTSPFLICSLCIIVMLLLALCYVIVISHSQNSIYREMAMENRQERKGQQDLLIQSLIRQEEEYQQIARNIHDQVDSKLNVIHLHLHQLIRANPPKKARVQQTLSILSGIIEDVRNISYRLMPPSLENFGLAAATEEMVDGLAQKNKVNIRLEIEGDPPSRPDLFLEVNLYRILQQLTSDALSQPQIREIFIALYQGEQGFRLMYRDKGEGIISQGKGGAAAGRLKNIASRLQMIKSYHHLEHSFDKGFQFVLQARLTH